MPSPHPPRPSFMSLKTLAHELDVSERTVQDMVKRGILPSPASFRAAVSAGAGTTWKKLLLPESAMPP